MLYQGIYTLETGDTVFSGKSGPLLNHDGSYYSVNPLSWGKVEIRYRLATMRDFDNHGVGYLAPLDCPD